MCLFVEIWGLLVINTCVNILIISMVMMMILHIFAICIALTNKKCNYICKKFNVFCLICIVLILNTLQRFFAT